MIASGNYIDAAYMKNLQKTWVVAETKSKMQAKTLKRKDFERLPHFQRAAYIKSGGKIFD